MWTGRKKDSKVGRDVCLDKDAEADDGAWWTYMIPKAKLKRMDTARGRCRTQWIKETLPWMDGGIRILPSALFMQYTKRMREYIKEYEEAKDEFLKDYPTIVEDAKRRLGKLAKGKRFPNVSEIRNKFDITLDVLPIPTVGDFRVQLGDKQLEKAQKEVERTINTMVDKAMEELWLQFKNLIAKVEATMSDPKKKFKDSIIKNLEDFCELVPKMNLTDDDKLESLRRDVKARLAQLKPDELRNNKHSRKKAAKTAKEILAKVVDGKGYAF
jgi:hypothetical protein